MQRRRPQPVPKIGEARTPVAVNRHFTLTYYPDYLDPTRFVQAFRNVWGKMPLAARRRIAAHWRTLGGTLQILPDLNNHDNPTAVGQTTCRRFVVGDKTTGETRLLSFLDAVMLLPDHAMTFTIAHELAHLYLLALGDKAEAGAWQGEDEVDEIAAEWCEPDDEWWNTEGSIWHRYVLRMFDGTRADTHAALCHAMASE